MRTILLIDQMSTEQRSDLEQKLKNMLGVRQKISSANQFHSLSGVVDLLVKCDQIEEEQDIKQERHRFRKMRQRKAQIQTER